jgi:hypothetical protein
MLLLTWPDSFSTVSGVYPLCLTTKQHSKTAASAHLRLQPQLLCLAQPAALHVHAVRTAELALRTSNMLLDLRTVGVAQ